MSNQKVINLVDSKNKRIGHSESGGASSTTQLKTKSQSPKPIRSFFTRPRNLDSDEERAENEAEDIEQSNKEETEEGEEEEGESLGSFIVSDEEEEECSSEESDSVIDDEEDEEEQESSEEEEEEKKPIKRKPFYVHSQESSPSEDSEEGEESQEEKEENQRKEQPKPSKKHVIDLSDSIEIDPSCIVSGKRQRKPVQRYSDTKFIERMLGDVPEEEIEAVYDEEDPFFHKKFKSDLPFSESEDEEGLETKSGAESTENGYDTDHYEDQDRIVNRHTNVVKKSMIPASKDEDGVKEEGVSKNPQELAKQESVFQFLLKKNENIAIPTATVPSEEELERINKENEEQMKRKMFLNTMFMSKKQ